MMAIYKCENVDQKKKSEKSQSFSLMDLGMQKNHCVKSVKYIWIQNQQMEFHH
jgi:hypothetical protein